jgi:hypothetical protein
LLFCINTKIRNFGIKVNSVADCPYERMFP